MKLLPAMNIVFWIACLIGILTPLIRNFSVDKLSPQKLQQQFNSFVFGLPLLLLGYLVAFVLRWDIQNTVLYALAGFSATWVLACLNLPKGIKGIALLIPAYLIASMKEGPHAIPMSLIAYMYGIVIAHWVNPKAKTENLLLPAIFCTGSHWIYLSSPEGWMNTYQTLLALSLSILFIVRSLQEFPILPASQLARAGFIAVVTGLLGWLGIQTFLAQPGLLHWAWLMAGGSLLSFCLADHHKNTNKLLQNSGFLIITGIAALVASRLFGTVGWIMLSAMLLSQIRPSVATRLVSLFFVGRVLLQSFIYQFNSNVTGINITHPYASAALYAGFALMLILPQLLTALSEPDHSNPDLPEEKTLSPIILALLGVAGLLLAGLSNYFLHAEATSSLLTSLLIAGLGVSLLSDFSSVANRFYPLLLSLLMSIGCLMSNTLIIAGNSADKPEKLWVLGGTLVLTMALTVYGQKKLLAGKTVEIS